jgi:undecaprenyl-diphosphatase
VLSFFQAIALGVIQGVTELFPVSSLGHSVVLPKLFGWESVVSAQSAKESYFLAFLVGLHVATALALLVFFRKEWAKIISGFFRSIGRRRVETSDERLAWLLVVATIPAGIMGLLFERTFRLVFAKPLAASVFLFINGLILFAGERLRRTSEARRLAAVRSGDGDGGGEASLRHLATLEYREAGVIGVAQVLALLAGISRSGITMVAGLVRGLDNEDAARFSFLLATPIILAAGVYKLPDLLGDNGNGVRGQILAGSVAAAIAAYLSVRFLTRYFETRNLMPFAAYCLVVGTALTIYFS